MTNQDVRELIHEALVTYIDDISMIKNVLKPKCNDDSMSDELVIQLKSGEEYILSLKAISQSN